MAYPFVRPVASLLFAGALLLCTSASAQPSPKGKAPAELPPLQPPLGRIGDVVGEVPKGGLPVGGEFLLVAKLPRCAEERTFYVERFLTQGAVGAAEQVHDWLAKTPAARERLFGKGKVKGKGKTAALDPLLQAIVRGRTGAYLEGRACPEAPALSADGRTVGLTAPRAICKPDRFVKAVPEEGITWVTSASQRDGALRQRDMAALVLLAPARAEAEDGCRPRMSATLYDDRAQARVRYSADWSGAAEVEIFGDRCARLSFRYSAERRQFLAVEDQTPGCKR